ncbi:hypothetical protein [Sphingomonas crusticola]|uniref:hypothetical protein n=1 Tax=Sphingomonas crusticola TaxID=1697973 RepID=UPI000E254697|nr:hypothetical protein [Sphingomonas crusticola]
MREFVYGLLAASLVAAPVAAARQTPEKQLAKLLQGRVAGKPVSCISLSRSSSDSMKIPGLAMAYRQGGTWYVNRFSDDCTQLSEDTILVTHTIGSRLCRGDSADLISATGRFPVGACIFGDFVPYTRPKG